MNDSLYYKASSKKRRSADSVNDTSPAKISRLNLTNNDNLVPEDNSYQNLMRQMEEKFKNFQTRIKELEDENGKYSALLEHTLAENVELANENANLRKEIEKISTLPKSKMNKSIKVIKTVKVAHSKKMNPNFKGMLEFKMGNESTIMQRLIYDWKATWNQRTTSQLLPDLPAYIIFMYLRYIDSINDGENFLSFMRSYYLAVKDIIENQKDDIDSLILWLLNSLRLLDNFKQYGENRNFYVSNTQNQDKQFLKNLSVSNYISRTFNLCALIYHKSIDSMQKKIKTLIVPAILGADFNPTSALHTLVAELNNFYKTLCCYRVNVKIIEQMFRQLFYFICATSLNNLFFRKVFCYKSKGRQILNNLSNLKMWVRVKRLNYGTVMATIKPIREAAALLLEEKTQENIVNICENYTHLNSQQICEILQLGSALDDFGRYYHASFTHKPQDQLQGNGEYLEENNLILDTTYTFPVQFSFNPSIICLADIEIPEVLNLPQ